MSITIFSAPVHSGKTTTLMHWCNNRKNVGGLLMPDINGTRNFLNIETKEFFDAACKFPEQCDKKMIRISSYHFYEDAFMQANKILINTSPDLQYIIIDEIGKLELQQKGLYEGTIHLLSRSSQSIILVVRDSLVEAVVASFNLTNYSFTNKAEEIAC